MPLPHTVRLHSDETALSFAARLALANKLPSLTEFLKDFELTIADALSGDEMTLAGLAELGAVDVAHLTKRMFLPSGKSSYRVLDFEVAKPHLLLGRNRICPACFRADIGDGMAEETVPNAYARIFWAFASARVCPIHHVLLIDPPDEDIKYEFVASWEPWLMEIAYGELDVSVNGQAKFETHLALRLGGGTDNGWAMRFPIDALGSACEMLGAALKFGMRTALSSLTEADLAIATDAGFTLLDAGPSAIISFFETLCKDSGSPQDKHQARYGRLYQWMARGKGSSADFTPLRV